MMKYFLIPIFVITLVQISQAQFRGAEPKPQNVSSSVVQSGPSPILGFIDLGKFSMKHSFSMSYTSFGKESMGLSKYTNSIMYRIAEPLSVRADVSMTYSPFNSLPQSFQNNINGVYLERAQIDYRPTDDMKITLQYRDMRGTYFPGYYPGYYGSYYDDRLFPTTHSSFDKDEDFSR